MKHLLTISLILSMVGEVLFKMIVSSAAIVYLINNLPLIMSLVDSFTRGV